LSVIRREFEVCKSCEHPNIGRVFEFYIDEFKSTAYIVMDLIEGKTLDSYVKDKGALDIEEARGLFSQLIRGLNFLHQEKGICHRDINPNNILIQTDGTLKIIDFNTAKQFISPITLLRNPMNQKTGQIPFGAPELNHMGPIGYTETVDCWSAACCLYFMLSGAYPFNSLGDR
jgi:serine/threonine protein kinase